MALSLFDILGPFLMRVGRIDAKADDLAVSLFELGFEPRGFAKLGGADGRKILWMRKQNCPLVSHPFVEVDWAFSGFSREVWCGVS